MFGKYITDEEYINTPDEHRVDHIAIIITNSDYSGPLKPIEHSVEN